MSPMQKVKTLSTDNPAPSIDINSLTVLRGITVQNIGDGRRLGWPTANIKIETTLPDGVYLAYASLAGYIKKPSTVFIGTPTTMGQTTRRVEAWLIDIPDYDYYAKELVISIIHYLRPNKTFKSIPDLIEALSQDEIYARDWFNRNQLL